MASMLSDMLLGQPCSLAQEPVALVPPECIPATVIYCVSKAEVETMRSVMNADARLRGRVRNYFRSPLCRYKIGRGNLASIAHTALCAALLSAQRAMQTASDRHRAEASCAHCHRFQLCQHHRSTPRSRLAILPWLQVASYSADKTHAERAQVQQAFDAGHISILIATTAFGLGINKKDIRWVRTQHAYCCAQTAAHIDLQSIPVLTCNRFDFVPLPLPQPIHCSLAACQSVSAPGLCQGH